jgi:two-component system, LytTR family, response regulator
MIKAIIVEDSRLARLELKTLLKSYPQVEITGEAESAVQALELISSGQPDLLFLDIHLPGKNGFELLQELDQVPAVIFTTAFDQYALQSFEYNTIDYLLKPIIPERLERAIRKAEEQLQQQKAAVRTEKLATTGRIFVKDGNKCWFVTIGDIRLFESKGNYTQIFFDKNSPLILKSIQHIENTLDSQQFIRVNRQQIINVKFIGNVAETFGGRLKLTLTTGEAIEVSRRQANRIREIFSL